MLIYQQYRRNNLSFSKTVKAAHVSLLFILTFAVSIIATEKTDLSSSLEIISWLMG